MGYFEVNSHSFYDNSRDVILVSEGLCHVPVSLEEIKSLWTYRVHVIVGVRHQMKLLQTENNFHRIICQW